MRWHCCSAVPPPIDHSLRSDLGRPLRSWPKRCAGAARPSFSPTRRSSRRLGRSPTRLGYGWCQYLPCQCRGVRCIRNQLPRQSTCTPREQPGFPKWSRSPSECSAPAPSTLRRLIGIGPDDRYATGSPLHHIGGLGNVLVALTAGAAVIPTNRFSFDWWRNLKQLQATHCLLVPTMIEMLLSERLLDAVPLKTLIYGASPITVETLRRVLDVLPDVAMVSLYGQTEGSPITSLSPDDHRLAAVKNPEILYSVGRPVSGLRLRIDEPDRAGIGEVFAAAAHLSAQAADGWLHTGDLGAMDADGYLRLCGRRHDMVVRGGENIYPLEVENVLSAHPAVAAVGVVGVPDPRLGETLAAFIVPTDLAHPPRPQELGSFARVKLAGFKIPQYWYSVAELPLSSAGKVVRATLRAAHLARQDDAST